MKALARRIRTTRLFGGLTVEQLTKLLEVSEIRSAPEGDIIIKEEDNNYHLLLLSGELEAQKTWSVPNGNDKSYTWYLNVSGSEGEFSYLGTMSRVRARAISDIRYILINADIVDKMLSWSQQLIGVVELNPKLKHLIGVCQNTSFFHQLPLENIKEAMEKLNSVDVEAGQVIMSQGDKGDCFYIIENGNAEVHQTDVFTDESKIVNKMGPGDSFGEEALIQDGFRSATVIMSTPGKLHYLEREEFDQLIKPSLVNEIQAEEALQLINSGNAKWLDCRYEIEYEDSRIPGAPLIPMDRIRWDTHKLDQKAKYVVYCRSGRRSKAAAFLLRERNIDAISLAGGIKDWPYDIDMQPLDVSGFLQEVTDKEVSAN